MKKNIFKTALSVLCCSLFIQTAVTAKQTDETIIASYNDIKLYIDNEKTVLKDADGKIAEPFIHDGTTYLPLRAVAEALSMNVLWDAEKNCIFLTSDAETKEHSSQAYLSYKGEKNLKISYRDISVYLDGDQLVLKSSDGKITEPFIHDGTTYLPLRAVAEATNTNVEWDDESHSIYLTSDDGEIPTTSTYDLSKTSDWTKEQAQNYGYTLDFDTNADKNYVKLIKYTGTETNVLIPSKIDGKTVYILGKSGEIQTELFTENPCIEYVSFENGVVTGSINYLFSDCKNLKGVYNIPRTTGIAATFRNCAKLRYVSGNFDDVSSASAAFSGCKKLESFPEFGSKLINIANAFEYCEMLSGDINIKSTKITLANNFLSGTKKQINLNVPAPSDSYNVISAETLPDNVVLTLTENKIAYLPQIINIATFTTIELQNYALTPEYADYDISWQCDIGKAETDKFSLSATEENVGQHPISVTLSKDGQEIYTAKSVLNIVSSKNISGKMVITCIGDVYTIKNEWKQRIKRYTERVSFAGTRSSTHEGRTGANTQYYLNSFSYTSDSNGFDKSNPFFNPDTNSFDWNYYKQYSGLSPSAVQLFFQNHTAKTPSENLKNIKTMVEAIRKDAPNMPIFIVQPAYLKLYNESTIQNNYEYAIALENEFADDENIYMIPLNLTYNNNLNNPKNKTPNEEGYNQWGDCIYGVYAAALSK